MRRILVVGDTHGHGAEWFKIFHRAAKYEVDAILQVGDFGYWEPSDDSKKYLKHVSRKATYEGRPVYWVDGNHEQFDQLWNGQYGESPDNPPFWRIRENLFYIPRGANWTWGGTTFGAMGGGVSIDRDWRTPGHSWFPQEFVTDEEIERIEPCDIVVAHDAPINPVAHRPDYKNDEQSTAHRYQMRKVADRAKPKLWLHGHYHHFHDTRDYSGMRVFGLNRDRHDNNMAVLELPYESWTDLAVVA